jgi:hypothetical protein
MVNPLLEDGRTSALGIARPIGKISERLASRYSPFHLPHSPSRHLSSFLFLGYNPAASSKFITRKVYA